MDPNALLVAELRRDEGVRRRPYLDTVGKVSIGVGRNLDDVGLSEDEIELLLINDITRTVADLDRHLPWWRGLSLVRQRVMVNMAFNMGIGTAERGLRSFRNTLTKIQAGDYEGAARGMAGSKWARQVGARATRLCQMMREG
jgi:lysozyme